MLMCKVYPSWALADLIKSSGRLILHLQHLGKIRAMLCAATTLIHISAYTQIIIIVIISRAPTLIYIQSLVLAGGPIKLPRQRVRKCSPTWVINALLHMLTWVTWVITALLHMSHIAHMGHHWSHLHGSHCSNRSSLLTAHCSPHLLTCSHAHTGHHCPPSHWSQLSFAPNPKYFLWLLLMCPNLKSWLAHGLWFDLYACLFKKF